MELLETRRQLVGAQRQLVETQRQMKEVSQISPLVCLNLLLKVYRERKLNVVACVVQEYDRKVETLREDIARSAASMHEAVAGVTKEALMQVDKLIAEALAKIPMQEADKGKDEGVMAFPKIKMNSIFLWQRHP